MSRVSYFSRRLFPILLCFSVIVIFAITQLDTLQNYTHIITWLTPVALLIVALIAGQFGQGRLSALCMLFGLAIINATSFAFSEISSVEHFTCQALLIAWLSWRKDTVMLSRAFVLIWLELLLLSGLFMGSYEQIQAMFQVPANQLHSTLFNLVPNTLARFTPFECLFYLSCLLPILSKAVWKPNHTHTLMLLAWLSTVIVAAEPSAIWLMAISCLIAGFVLLAIISFSFTMAYRDELTCIPSRRALMQHINGLGRNYVVVMADIDHFKKFNDTHGHNVGDQVLKLVAQKLNAVGGGGKAFRYGGEEFTLVFSGKSCEHVKPFVEVVRESIESYPIVLRSKDRPTKPPKKPQKSKAKPKHIKVTCSFGIAERDSENNAFEAVMKQADEALYAAKKAGRNCIMLAKQ